MIDRNPNSRRLAAELAGEVCSAGVETGTCQMALAALVDRVDESDPEVRQAISRALESIPAEGVVAAQLELLAEEERSDHDEVLAFLKQLLDHAAVGSDQRTAAREQIRALGFPVDA